MLSLTAATQSPPAWMLATLSLGCTSTRPRGRWFTAAVGLLTKLVREVLDVPSFFIAAFQVKIPIISRLRSTATFGEILMIFTTHGIQFWGSSISTARTRTGLVSLRVLATGMILTCWLLAITGCHWTRRGLRWGCGQCLRGTNINDTS